MRNLLKLLVVAVFGYIVYELITRYLADRQAAEALGGVQARPLGSVPGAAMTAGGSGQVQRTLGPDGSTNPERVGRGVVRRQEA